MFFRGFAVCLLLLDNCLDGAVPLLGSIVVGAKYLQSFPRQLGVIDGPTIGVNSTGLRRPAPVFAAIVVDVIQVKSVDVDNRTARESALNALPADHHKRLPLQNLVGS